MTKPKPTYSGTAEQLLAAAIEDRACLDGVRWARKWTAANPNADALDMVRAMPDADWPRWCSYRAARRGDYEAAERFAAESEDPGWARRWCAVEAAERGDHDAAERFRRLAEEAGQ